MNKKDQLKGEILKIQRYTSRLYFQDNIAIVRILFPGSDVKDIPQPSRRLGLKKVYVRIIPHTRGSPLTVDIVAPLPTIIFYSSGSFCSAHNRVNARRKGPSNTL